MGTGGLTPIPLGVYAAARFAEMCTPFLLALGKLESGILREEIDAVSLQSPVYIAGLARSGSTLLLEVLASAEGVATHRYRDFPFPHIPWLWDRVLRFMPRPSAPPQERAHGDRMLITPESPEAMEEMLWMAFFKDAHHPAVSNVLDGRTSHPAFEAFYRDHIRKLLLARRAERYVSKGNYNVARLAYLHALFPGSKFIIPIREPVAHVASLMRQHENFLAQAAADARVAHYLRIAGHFEFGPDVRFLNLGTPPPVADAKPHHWARYWAQTYAHVHHVLEIHPDLRRNALVVRYEDLCRRPAETLHAVLDFCGLQADVDPWATRIQARDYYRPSFTPAEQEAIAQETLETGRLFGYP